MVRAQTRWEAALDMRNGSGEIAVVLPGGGARGAYEVGALSVLLPALAARGERATIYCGTSVGAINAALLAATAHEPAERQIEAVAERWRALRRGDVLAPLIGPHGLLAALRFGGELVGIPGVHARSVLDAKPLRRNLEEWIDWPTLHENTRGGVVTICVVATSLAHGVPVAFVEGPGRGHRSASIRYVRAKLDTEHIRASAAIPILFPPVRVDAPRGARGYYVDGATRLNTPLKPALDLGARKVIVIGYEPLASPRRSRVAPRPPHGSDVMANVIDGLLLDQVNSDLHRLAAINTFFTDDFSPMVTRGARAYREARGRHAYRRVSYAIVTPERERELGRIAEEIFSARTRGLRALLHPDQLLLGRLLGSGTASRGELLSFLLFDPEYVDALIELGRRDAGRWLDRHPAFWCADGAHDFDMDPAQAAAAQEAESLEEWRALRRR